jgi:Ca2+-binding RTX toxin-like protein
MSGDVGRLTGKERFVFTVFEQLENRQLMSASPLYFNGTEGHDEITVTQDGGTIHITTAQFGVINFNAAVVSKVVIDAKGGADLVNCSDPNLQVGVEIRGGAGTDILIGSVHDDVIYGGEGTADPNVEMGADLIKGLDGKDKLFASFYTGAYIYGGNNSDTITGFFGNDEIYGEDGKDTVNAGFGNDYVTGGKGDDTIHGEYGDDTLDGQDGNDKVYGDKGTDILYGGKGKDELHGGEGDDALYGGDDNDKLFGEAGIDVLNGEKGDDQLTQ